ncbi:putative fatty acid transporter FAT2 [Hysterangium stoloniferum]|nr:putative fatty acid transporter FAT2 [Hysterangium stoloniferum]
MSRTRDTTLAILLESRSWSGESPTALVLPEPINQSVSYAQLKALVLEFRSALTAQLGVKTGDVVAMSFVNGLEFVVGFLGTGMASRSLTYSRAISAPLNPAYSTPEVEFYLGDTKPVLLLLPNLASLGASSSQLRGARAALQAAKKLNVRTAEFSIVHGRPSILIIHPAGPVVSPSAIERHEEPLPSDVALVLHTSGTTSRPKSVPLTHHNLLTTAKNIVGTYALTNADRSYLVMPLFHVHGLLAGLLAPLRSGASVVIPERFSASRFWPDFCTHACTWYTAVPTIHAILLDTPLPKDGPPPIRFIRSCSSSLPPVLMERLEKTFKAPVCEAYAMTEAAHQMTSNMIDRRLPNSVGVGVGVQVAIRDDQGNGVKQGEKGEVCVRGENVTRGYWNNEKANQESFWGDGWFRTGDQGVVLPSGYLRITGRLKELINRGGEKISPLEVDAALLRVDGVAEAVSFGVEDEKYGEVVWAGVVLQPGQPAGAEHRIKKAMDGQLAGFKIPSRIVITESIPKTATGKVQRRHVKEAFVKRVREVDSRLKAKL